MQHVNGGNSLSDLKHNINNIYKMRGNLYFLVAVLTTLSVGFVIYYLLSFYRFFSYTNTSAVNVYIVIFCICLGTSICQGIIGLHLCGRIQIKKSIIHVLGYVCLAVNIAQTCILTFYIVAALLYKFSIYRPLHTVSLIPIIFVIPIIFTIKTGFAAIELDKSKKLSIILIYLYVTYITIISMLAFFPFDYDLNDRFIYPLGLREKYIQLNDIQFTGGKVVYTVYIVYIVIGTLIFSLLSLSNFSKKGKSI